MAIKIPVSASINAAEIGAEIDKLGQAIAQANKVKYEPVPKGAVKDLEQVERKFRSLLQINREMSRRLSVSGQQDKGFFDIDWSKAYENNHTRARKMAQAFQYVTGSGFSQAPANAPTSKGGAITNAIAGATQAGLRASNGATAGVGGVVANSLGTGMSSGFGAGMAGLLGGILALGVGKVVGAAVEKLDEAESNAWASDRLKRMIGDVQVSFRALETVVNSSSKALSVTYAEGNKLATQFAKIGNVTESQYLEIGQEIETGGGMSKSYGLDPSVGVGFMAQMRGSRLTNDVQDSRRLGLVIGETIAKSNAFAKADEVMDAIAGYATSQARQSLSAGTTAYAGALAGLAGSNMAGLDVGGSSAILNRANAALTSGGAKGEASQFFSASIGAKYGLDPYQLQMWREGGAFATLDDTFGEGSMASKFGMKGPKGDKTWMQATLDELRGKYGHNPAMLANATANHLGLSMSQAMAVTQFKPAQIGEMQKRLGEGFDLKDLNASAIGTMGRILTGDSSVMESVAGDLKSRKDLTAEERTRIDEAMASGNLDKQKDLLMRLVASREQEQTDGKNIHDSKIALENIKTDMATKLIPLTQSIRDGILFMAGGGKKSQYEINQEMLDLESSSKQKRINRTADADIESAQEEFNKKEYEILADPNATGRVKDQDWWKSYQEKRKNGTLTKDEETDFKHELETARRLHGARFFGDDVADRLESAKREREGRVKAIEERRSRDIKTEQENLEKGKRDLDKADRSQLDAPTQPKSLDDFKDKDEKANLAAFLDTIGISEHAGYNTIVGGGTFDDFSKHPNKVGLVTGDGPSTAAGKYQFIYPTWKRVAKKLGLTDFSPESQDRAAIELLRERGALEDVLKGNFPRAVGKIGPEWQSMPTGTSRHQGKRSWSFFDRTIEKQLRRRREEYAPEGNEKPFMFDGVPSAPGLAMSSYGRGTPMPDDAVNAERARAQRMVITAAPIEVIHKNDRGESVAPRQMLATTIKPASPFGTERYS